MESLYVCRTYVNVYSITCAYWYYNFQVPWYMSCQSSSTLSNRYSPSSNQNYLCRLLQIMNNILLLQTLTHYTAIVDVVEGFMIGCSWLFMIHESKTHPRINPITVNPTSWTNNQLFIGNSLPWIMNPLITYAIINPITNHEPIIIIIESLSYNHGCWL